MIFIYCIYFIGKSKIMFIVNENIFLCYFNIVIQSLGSVGQRWYRQNNTIKKLKKYRPRLSLAVNMARFGNINTDEFTYFFCIFQLQNETLCIQFIIILSPREQFSYSSVWWNIVSESTTPGYFVGSGTIPHQTTL